MTNKTILTYADIDRILEGDASGLLEADMIRRVEAAIMAKLNDSPLIFTQGFISTVVNRLEGLVDKPVTRSPRSPQSMDEGDAMARDAAEAWEAIYHKMKNEVADFDSQAGLTGIERVAKHLDILIAQAGCWDVVQMQLLKCEPSLKDQPGNPGNVAADVIERVYCRLEGLVNITSSADVESLLKKAAAWEKIQGVLLECEPSLLRELGEPSERAVTAIERIYHRHDNLLKTAKEIAELLEVDHHLMHNRGVEAVMALIAKSKTMRNVSGVAFAASPNTINYQGYNAAGELVAMCTRSSFDVSRDTHLMDAALTFDDAAERGVLNIVDHKVGNLYISTRAPHPVGGVQET